MGLFTRFKKKKMEETPEEKASAVDQPEKNQRKPFGETKVGQWADKVKGKFPDLIGNVLDIATSGNPFGAVLDKVKEKLQGKINDPRVGEQLTAAARELLLEADQKIREWKKDMYTLAIEDRNSARDMYVEKGHEKADKIANKVINWNLVIVAVLVIIEVLVVKFLDKTEVALLSGTIGFVINALLHERLTVINFFFGSSLGSKNKQAELNRIKSDGKGLE